MADTHPKLADCAAASQPHYVRHVSRARCAFPFYAAHRRLGKPIIRLEETSPQNTHQEHSSTSPQNTAIFCLYLLLAKMDAKEPASEKREIIHIRMLCLRLQLTQTLTPLLRKETQQLLDLHSAALQEDLAIEVNLLKNLSRLHKQLKEHWCKVYKNHLRHSFLLVNMLQFQSHLTGLLLHDYAGESYSPTEWVTLRATTVRQKNAAMRFRSSELAQAHDSDDVEAHDSDSSDQEGDNNDWEESYHDGIVLPLEEMTLNVAHAEERLFSAESEQQGLSGAGYVTELIRRTDWKKLGETLLNDRELARVLFSKKSIVEDCFDDKTSRKVFDGIKRVEQKYFVHLISPATYTISKHAMDLSARCPSSSSTCESLPLREAGGSSDVSTKDRARRVFSAIAGGIKGLGTVIPKGNPQTSHSSSNASGRDEKALLVDLEDD